MLKGTVNLGEYIKTIDLPAMGIDVTEFGKLSDSHSVVKGDTMWFGADFADPAPLRFDAHGLVDHDGLKRGAVMSIEFDNGLPSITGMVTGRYKQRDGTVHAWGIVNP